MKITKRELQDYCWLKLNIQKLEDRLQVLQSRAESVTQSMEQEVVSGGCKRDRLGDSVAEIVKVSDQINRELNRMYRTELRIREAISVLPEREKMLMTLRYLECKSWEEVAVEMGYSWQHVHKIHPRCLEILGVLKRGDRMRVLKCDIS